MVLITTSKLYNIFLVCIYLDRKAMILFVNDLTVIDFSYLCSQRGAIGESWIVDLTLHGALNEESMVLDFGIVKKQIKRIIDETLDHKLALPIHSEISIQTEKNQTNVAFNYNNGKTIAISAPDQAFCKIEAHEIDKTSVIAYLENQIMPQLPENIKKIELTLRAENINGFYYHYSHGLKKHDGNCQRIVHGHRSTINIFENNMKSPKLERAWAQKFEDIYIGSEEDLVTADSLKNISPLKNAFHFAYHAPQGYFELSILKSQCFNMPCDTTVECIAEQIAKYLKQDQPENNYKVVAFEGVGKGSISYA